LFGFLKETPKAMLQSLGFADNWLNWLFSFIQIDEETRGAIEEIFEIFWGNFVEYTVDIEAIIGNIELFFSIRDEDLFMGSDDSILELIEQMSKYANSAAKPKSKKGPKKPSKGSKSGSSSSGSSSSSSSKSSKSKKSKSSKSSKSKKSKSSSSSD